MHDMELGKKADDVSTLLAASAIGLTDGMEMQKARATSCLFIAAAKVIVGDCEGNLELAHDMLREHLSKVPHAVDIIFAKAKRGN